MYLKNKSCILALILLKIVVETTSKPITLGCPPSELISPCRCLMKSMEFQVWCSHSDLERILNGLKNIGRHLNAPIDELILENNYLPSLPGRTFSNLKVLRLMVRQNGLERVSQDWLYGLEGSLMELFLVEPKMRYFPDESLARLNVLEAITIQTKNLKRLPLVRSLKKLRYLQIESVALADLFSTNFKDLPSLENFQLSGSIHLRKLEANLFENLPSLRRVNISSCGINWVHPNTFFNLPKLNQVSLVDNQIQDAGMIGISLKDQLALRTLNLDKNKITKLLEASFVDIPSLETLTLDQNKIIEISQGAFHKLPNLKRVKIDQNSLRKIHFESFFQGSSIEELYMVKNEISQVNQLKSILGSLPRLIYLDISFNLLEIIPFGILRGHPTLEILKLNHNKLYQVDRETFSSMPSLRELELKNNSLTNFNQEPLWSLPSLKGLDISFNFYRRIEPKFLANLPLLHRLDASFNELVTIDPLSFKHTRLLEFVNISNNNLYFIHPSTFSQLENLYEIDASKNQLEEFLVELPSRIEHLHLSHNKLRKFPFLTTDSTLKYLDLSNNFIENLNGFTAKKLPHLKKLLLRNNLINNLQHFNDLNKLNYLDLSGNKIIQIAEQNFVKNNKLGGKLVKENLKLSQLDLSNNQLKEINFLANLNRISTIKSLNISNNLLTKLPQDIHEMKQLKTLDFSRNKINKLHSETFKHLQILKDLRMSGNYLEHLETNTFSNMVKLQILDLTHNELKNIETKTFNSLPSLEMVNLNHNKLNKIPNFAFNNLTMLQIVLLQQNNLKIISENAFSLVPNLLILNLSRNLLSSFEDAGLKNLHSLEVLDLSHNKLEKLESNSFKKMEWLVELRLDNNLICGISGNPFSKMPRLRVITLKNNKLKRIQEGVVDKIRTNLAVFDLDNNPLICDCSALWIQVLSEETQLLGPHCNDGTLLREIPLKKCEKDVEYLESCDGNNLNLHTSQIFSKYTSNNKNVKEPPLPQESDYFYDEYIDYPFNDTLNLDNLDNLDEKFVRLNFTTVSPHLTPGDTPTLYAATSTNKPIKNLPKIKPHSPSSSGFTFFGVPLPSINFNQLLGGENSATTGGRGIIEKTAKPKTNPVSADRKMAIMNVPSKTQNAGIIFKPPPPPMIENGGFRPMLPGEGGFVPSVLETTTAAIPRVDQAIGSTSQHQSLIIVEKKQENVTTTTPRSTTTLPKETIQVATSPAPTTEKIETTTLKIVTTTKGFVKNISKPIENVTEIVSSTLPPQHLVQTEIETSTFAPTTPTFSPTTSTVKNFENSPSSLKTFLAPGGLQQNQYFTTKSPISAAPMMVGRSKITKVEASEINNSRREKQHFPKEINLKTTTSTTTVVNLDPELTKMDEVKENWYFANYNKTYNSEMYRAEGALVNGAGKLNFKLGLIILIGFRIGWINSV